MYERRMRMSNGAVVRKFRVGDVVGYLPGKREVLLYDWDWDWDSEYLEENGFFIFFKK